MFDMPPSKKRVKSGANQGANSKKNSASGAGGKIAFALLYGFMKSFFASPCTRPGLLPVHFAVNDFAFTAASGRMAGAWPGSFSYIDRVKEGFRGVDFKMKAQAIRADDHSWQADRVCVRNDLIPAGCGWSTWELSRQP